ncbi:MAG: TetR/AcrR family transcriptional regulator [Sandaracinaceae bacterium]
MTPKASSRRSRQDWVMAAVEALGEGGPSAIRVEPLAKRLGVTKGSFYWHFKRREELVEAVLDTWEQAGTESIIRDVQAESGADARRTLTALWARTLFEAADKLRAELAIRQMAARDASTRERVARVDERRMEFLRHAFRELGLSTEVAEARALMLYSLLLGNYFIASAHGSQTRAEVLETALEELLTP